MNRKERVDGRGLFFLWKQLENEWKEGEKRHLEEEEVYTSQVFTLSFQLKMNVDPTPPSLCFSCRVSIHSTFCCLKTTWEDCLGCWSTFSCSLRWLSWGSNFFDWLSRRDQVNTADKDSVFKEPFDSCYVFLNNVWLVLWWWWRRWLWRWCPPSSSSSSLIRTLHLLFSFRLFFSSDSCHLSLASLMVSSHGVLTAVSLLPPPSSSLYFIYISLI